MLKYVTVADANGTVRDAFRCASGVLSPVSNSELVDAAQAGTDAKAPIDSLKESPEGFHHKLDEVIDKYGEK